MPYLVTTTDPTGIARGSNIAKYTSYDLAWLAPILYPLTIAVVAQCVIYSDLIIHRLRGTRCLPSCGSGSCRKASSDEKAVRTSGRYSDVVPSADVELPVLLMMASETIFAICCTIQCYINFGSRAFVGLVPACSFQGFYSGYYLFSATSLAALTAAVGARVIVNKSPPSRLVVGVTGIVLHGVSGLLAALPLLGVGQYRFPRDYCMPDIETPFFAGIFWTWWTVSSLTIVVATGLLLRSDRAVSLRAKLLLGFIAVYFTVAWSPAVLIGIDWATGGTPSEGGLYGFLAIFLHSNQLVVPVLWAGCLRSHMYEALASGDANLRKAAGDGEDVSLEAYGRLPLPSTPSTVAAHVEA